MDLDLILRVDSSSPLTDEVLLMIKENMGIIIMKKTILKAFKGSMFEKATTAKEFLVQIEQNFFKNKKIEIGTLLTSLISMRYTSKGNIRENIMEMSHFTSKLKTLNLASAFDFNIFTNIV